MPELCELHVPVEAAEAAISVALGGTAELIEKVVTEDRLLAEPVVASLPAGRTCVAAGPYCREGLKLARRTS